MDNIKNLFSLLNKSFKDFNIRSTILFADKATCNKFEPELKDMKNLIIKLNSSLNNLNIKCDDLYSSIGSIKYANDFMDLEINDSEYENEYDNSLSDNNTKKQNLSASIY